MTGFALFRLPYAMEATCVRQTTGEPTELKACQELNGRQGFVMAPFEVKTGQPILLIRPDEVTIVDLREGITGLQGAIPPLDAVPTAGGSRDSYAIDFANFHAQLCMGTFQKIVLARCADEPQTEALSPEALFMRACERYPRLFVSLTYTSQSGLWLTATPEVLLENSGDEWKTIALAGTVPFSEDVRWSDKNIQEQRYVATYITEQLKPFTDHVSEQGPYTARAGHLAHLRSDFCFTLYNSTRVGDLLQSLHPTPAVCGLPKHEAFRFIMANESHGRSYYSGFMGPLDVEQNTSLYVTLRCMHIFRNGYHLYAGGGLLTDSVEELEWQETETKLDTMRRIICNENEIRKRNTITKTSSGNHV